MIYEVGQYVSLKDESRKDFLGKVTTVLTHHGVVCRVDVVVVKNRDADWIGKILSYRSPSILDTMFTPYADVQLGIF
jgi:hypothetical protein